MSLAPLQALSLLGTLDLCTQHSAWPEVGRGEEAGWAPWQGKSPRIPPECARANNTATVQAQLTLYTHPNLRLSRENFNFPWIFMFQPPEKLPLWALLPSCQPSMTEAAPAPPREGGDWSSLAGLGKAQRQRQQQGRQPPGPDHSDAEEPYVAELA